MTDPSPLPTSKALPAAVTVGFGTALAMWVLGYITHLPGLAPTTETAKITVGIALITLQTLGLSLAGVATPRSTPPAITGAAAGFVCGLINLLILGALISEPPVEGGTAVAPNANVTALGFLAFSIATGAIAAPLARPLWSRLLNRFQPKTNTPPLATDAIRWRARIAVLAALAVVPVLITGGLVTSHNAGLAVPDWPNSYTANMFLYPLSKMTGGIYYEHTHRLFGTLAGLGTVILLAYSLTLAIRQPTAEPKRWRAPALAFATVLLISSQGLLGGLRVQTADGATNIDEWKPAARETVYTGQAAANDFALTVDNATSLTLAAAHGVSGQVTFAAVAVLAALLSIRWMNRTRQRTQQLPHDTFLRVSAVTLLVMAITQLSLGSLTRHHESLLTLMLHASLGTLIVLVGAMAAFRAIYNHRNEHTLRYLGITLLAVMSAQFLLGWVATFYNAPLYDGVRDAEPTPAVLAATAHQALGAAFLALTALLTAWTFRLTASAHNPTLATTTANTNTPYKDTDAPVLGSPA